MALAIEAVQATPPHISQHFDAAIIISTEREAASARRERHVRRLLEGPAAAAAERLLSLSCVTVPSLAVCCNPHQIRPSIHYSSSSIIFSIVNTTTTTNHYHSAASPACLPAHGPTTHIPINILLPLSSPYLTSLPPLPHTHSLFLPDSRVLLCPTPYPALHCAPLRAPAPEASVALVLARMTRPTLLRLTLPPPPAPLPNCPSRRI